MREKWGKVRETVAPRSGYEDVGSSKSTAKVVQNPSAYGSHPVGNSTTPPPASGERPGM